MVVQPQDPKVCRLVDCGELVAAPRAELEVFDVNLHRLARDVNVAAGGPGRYPFKDTRGIR